MKDFTPEELTLIPLQTRHPVLRALPIVREELVRSDLRFNYADDYELRIQCAIRFKATPQLLDDAVQDARQHFIRSLYRPVVDGLHQLRLAAYSTDVSDVLKRIDDLEKTLGV